MTFGKIFEYTAIMKKLFFAALLFLSVQSFAQDTTLTKPVDSSTVTVHKDERLDLLITRQIQANELASRDARRTAKGFRLLIISTNSRDEAISTKSQSLNHTSGTNLHTTG
jgi:hypothetical protein